MTKHPVNEINIKKTPSAENIIDSKSPSVNNPYGGIESNSIIGPPNLVISSGISDKYFLSAWPVACDILNKTRRVSPYCEYMGTNVSSSSGTLSRLKLAISKTLTLSSISSATDAFF